MQQLENLIGSLGAILGDSLDDHAAHGVLAQLQIDRGRLQQIFDELIVNLQVRERHLELGVCKLWIGAHALKHAVESVHHHSRLLEAAEHRVRLAGTRGAVRKHRRVVSVEHAAHEAVGGLLKDSLLLDLVVEDHVESVALLLHPVGVPLCIVPRIEYYHHLALDDLHSRVVARFQLLW